MTLNPGTVRVRKNIMLDHRRTSVSLETAVWDGLVDICRREELSIDELCSDVNRMKTDSSLSSALRVFQLMYFRYLVNRNAGDTSGAEQAPGLASPSQADFPGPYDYALGSFKNPNQAA